MSKFRPRTTAGCSRQLAGQLAGSMAEQSMAEKAWQHGSMAARVESCFGRWAVGSQDRIHDQTGGSQDSVAVKVESMGAVVGGRWPLASGWVMAEVVQPSAAAVRIPRVHDSTSIRTRTSAYHCYYVRMANTQYYIVVLASSRYS